MTLSPSSMPRTSGVLLHPSSLPGRFGIGDFGPSARWFADALAKMGQRLWQLLPLGPTGYGDSPYQPLSSFAISPLFISPEDLVRDNLLSAQCLSDVPKLPDNSVDYASVIALKRGLLKDACDTFAERASAQIRRDYEAFRHQHGPSWLDDYALFTYLKERHGGAPWYQWPDAYCRRDPSALKAAASEGQSRINEVTIEQFLLFAQWRQLLDYCHAHGIMLVGDLPIFIAHDSADAWAHRDIFEIGDGGECTHVAGVPPDYFSDTGQRWGNPLHRWTRMAEDGYGWWRQRITHSLEMFDFIRIDHFRGFESYWEIPAHSPTAIEGRWVPGPGEDFFRSMAPVGESLPIIAEDLGLVTEEVEALRVACGFPGMRVLQFGFSGDPHNKNLPKNYPEDCVCYTGTHDNDTIVSWVATHPEEGHRMLAASQREEDEVHWRAIELTMSSRARWTITPLQDILGLGSDGRMNQPGTTQGNWQWRFRYDQLQDDTLQRMRELTRRTDRLGK